MTTLFKKLFIKNYKDIDNPKVRTAYGTSAGVLGIVANCFLFVIKLIGGLLSGSVAVIADAINNLTDFMTSIITMVGFKISGKPADKDHPFGHARFEYVTGLLIACVIFFIGFETGRAAVEKIFSSSPTSFSIITCIILAVSVLIKIFLAIVMRGLSKDINSDAIKAMSTDNRNDAFSTTIVLICAIIGLFNPIPLDGYLGAVVSVLVLISAINLIKETVSPLIGEPPSKDLLEQIETTVKSYDGILGTHELIVHNYGPTQAYATVHIEVDSRVDVMISHELADNIERDVLKKLNVNLVCHIDPLNLSDPETSRLSHDILSLLNTQFEGVTMHDLRIVKGPTFTNVIFDAVVPFGKEELIPQIKEKVDEVLSKEDGKYFAVIEFETGF